MRLVCLFLLFVNAGYGVWNAVYVQASPREQATMVAPTLAKQNPSGGKPLVLVEEVSDGPSSRSNKQKTEVALPRVETPAKPSVNPIESPLVATIQSSEQREEKRDAQASVALEKREASHSKPFVCWAAGPLLQPSDADHFEKRAKALASQVHTETLNVKTGEEFWVYLKPLASHKAALRKLRELQSQKIDSFIVTRGDFKNAISLGLFSKMESAERHKATLAKKGLEAQIEVRDRTRREFWVQFHLKDKLESPIKQKLKGELDAIEWHQVNCDKQLTADL